MTKSEILEELDGYGVDATLRPRKATLVALLNEKRENDMSCNKDKCEKKCGLWCKLFCFFCKCCK